MTRTREVPQNKVAESLRIVADNMPEGYPSEREILNGAAEEIYRLEGVIDAQKVAKPSRPCTGAAERGEHEQHDQN